ncbi:glycoside hydrolase family 5 protein [Eubacterium oxidoreducens]|uniref:cellulase n=1 Tax=Eubacterium oxidoreducens TaxID=1732 RepID=A0A1G6CFY0_EUBOX|nr:glycoside hydrolase family 5 protein [Eubacterium oxidoreducens]SDB31725.1 endoglucanase [Eubacterium oxidoreducens]
MKKWMALLVAMVICIGAIGGTAGSITKAQAAVSLEVGKTALPRLHVSDTKLVNAKGKKVQLRGVSTHGLAWYPQYVNKKAFSTLKKDWKANVVRLALYTEEYGGYCNTNAAGRKNLEALIDKGVKYAAMNKMYVIIDWHILSDGNPKTHQKAAVKFFKKMAKKYKGYTNVIYEICNEPNGGNVSWTKTIRPYAKKVVKAIRKYDKKAVVIVGTGTWSQDVDAVIGHQLGDDNVMYALHFYAGTHGSWLRDKAEKAIDAGVPVFVSECNITDASGDGNINKSEGNAWMKWMKKHKISYVAWNLSNKGEDSALIKSSCAKKYGWKKSQLSTTGKWFRKKIRG